MWTRETRAEHDRDDQRYPSDLTDAERQVLAPLLPPPARTGRRRSWTMREIMNAMFYVLRGGCPWRMLPEHFPPHQTAYRWFTRFRDDGTWERLDHQLVARDRERVGRGVGPTAAVIDTQSVKTTESGGLRGYDAGKKINGRKRHALVDTGGRSLELQVHPASVQDRDGAPAVLQAAHARFPSIRKVFADSVYAGERVANATSIVVEIVRKLPNQVGFKLLPRRWVVERFFAWVNRNRRLAKGFEATIASATAFLHAARQAAGSFGLRFESDSQLICARNALDCASGRTSLRVATYRGPYPACMGCKIYIQVPVQSVGKHQFRDIVSQ